MNIWVVRNPEDVLVHQPPVNWAVGELEKILANRDIALHPCERIDQVPSGEFCFWITSGQGRAAQALLSSIGVTLPKVSEALGLLTGTVEKHPVLFAWGSDVRGLVYAVLELVDRVTYMDNPSSAFFFQRPVVEQPANALRSIARLFTSEVEDKPWFYDKDFWRHYLTMLAAQRFNRFSLTLGLGYNFPRHIQDAYFYFAYPFFLKVPGYSVKVVGLPEEEREKNLAMLRFISDEASARGLHFQLGLWTHAYEWQDSPEANYTIEGLTPGNHAEYCRSALRTLLEACPSIAGVTFRVHGESGIPERSYDFWRTVFQGIVQCGRQVEIDMHAKGIDQKMIEVALATGMPVNVSPKYWAEHMGLPYHQASIRDLELPPKEAREEGFMALSGGSRRFLRYGYGDLLTEDRPYGVFYRIWPGTQRLLLWGDPAMAKGYGRWANFCGCLGLELCEPLSFKGRMGSGLPGGRDGYADSSLRPPGGDWEKYLYTYRLFGRLLYNPEADPETWRRYLRKEWGAAAKPAEEALAKASRVLPLITVAHHPSASNNAYWPEIYTNMPIVSEQRPHPYGDTPRPKRFGAVSPLDPQLFSRVEDFAEELTRGELSGKISPLEVAKWLEDFCREAEHHLREAEKLAEDPSLPSFRRLAVDVAIQVGLGRFFAHKLRAGMGYALYEQTGDKAFLKEAIEEYHRAQDAWRKLSEQAKGIYVEDLTFGPQRHLRGHWLDRLPAIEEDIQDMEQLREEAEKPLALPKDAEKRAKTARAMLSLLSQRGPQWSFKHNPPDSFQRGEPVIIELSLLSSGENQPYCTLRLHYRHVNQAEPYTVVEMREQDGRYQAVIPGDYTDSPYPLQYFFEVRDVEGRAYFYPGFEADLSNQPYYVIRQAR